MGKVHQSHRYDDMPPLNMQFISYFTRARQLITTDDELMNFSHLCEPPKRRVASSFFESPIDTIARTPQSETSSSPSSAPSTSGILDNIDQTSLPSMEELDMDFDPLSAAILDLEEFSRVEPKASNFEIPDISLIDAPLVARSIEPVAPSRQISSSIFSSDEDFERLCLQSPDVGLRVVSRKKYCCLHKILSG